MTLPRADRVAETLRERMTRTAETARIFRDVADDAIAENQRAYDRAADAKSRWENAQHEADMAEAAWVRAGCPD